LSIFVDDDKEVRLSPFRIEAHLARGLTLGDDQIVSRDVLEMLTPEIYEGRPPIDRQEMDAHGQYYLGLLSLELLLGRRPVQIACLKDLRAMEGFFHDPRAHFELGGATRWADEAPALAFVLAKLLARRPGERLKSAEEASAELGKVANGDLPDVLRRCLEADYETMVQPESGFVVRFYQRLFAARPALASMFDRSPADQSVHLTSAIQDLVEFHKGERLSRFLGHARAHAKMGITSEDADAFRRAFVAEVVSTCELSRPNISAQMHGDAWNAVLKLGIDEMLGC
jgi:hemoglobin-like flavoprotein